MSETIYIAQSDDWSNYVALYGWKSFKIKNGSILRIRGNFFTRRAAMQIPKELSIIDLEEIEEICRTNKVHYLKISPNEGQNLKYLEQFKYKQTKNIDLAPNTMYIDLTPDTQAIFNHFSNSCRYSINKAKRERCYTEIIRNPTPKEILEFYKVLSYRAKKKHFTILGLKDIQKKVESFGENSFICNIYNEKGQILGAKFFLGFGDVVWGIHSGTTKLGQKSTAGYKLLFDCVPYFKSLGYRKMDLGGIRDPRLKNLSKGWEHYSHYKREFNGKVIYYSLPYYKWFYSLTNVRATPFLSALPVLPIL